MTSSLSDDPWGGANPLDPTFREDPYPALKRLRETQPVHRAPFDLWRLSRYADVERLLKDVPAGVRRTDGTHPDEDGSTGSIANFMLRADPPDHSRLRRLANQAFTPRSIDSWRDRANEVVEGLLDRVAGRGHMDLIADLALPLPATLICELLGVPPEDMDRFTSWTADATHGLAARMAPPEVVERARRAAENLGEYFSRLIAGRRGALGDDLLSALIRAEEEGDQLSEDELLSQSIGLLIAGFETTIGLIGNGVVALIRHPEELAKLRDAPSLINSAVEECLRFDGPITLTARILHEETEFSGTSVPKDARIFALLAAANRDPEIFPDPDRFDIERRENFHFAFGGGVHFCLGAHLARMEAQAAIGGLVARFDGLRLSSEKIQWGPSLFRVPGRALIYFEK